MTLENTRKVLRENKCNSTFNQNIVFYNFYFIAGSFARANLKQLQLGRLYNSFVVQKTLTFNNYTKDLLNERNLNNYIN